MPAAVPISYEQLLIIVAVTTVGALLQGSIGFGLNLLAAPTLMLVDPAFVPGPLIADAIVLTLLMIWREHRHLDFSGVGWAFVGRVPGSFVGLALLVWLPPSQLKVVFGMMILVGVAMSMAGVNFRPTPKSLVGAGAAAGIMSITTSVGGPPMALVYQAAPGNVLRATLSGQFCVGALLSILVLVVGGRFGATELWYSTVLIPGTVVGYLLSSRLTAYLDRGYLRPAVLGFAGVTAVAIILREVLA
jgi:uncharacterized membrane protein YfcA